MIHRDMKFGTHQLAISMAASWAWGASLVVGIAVLLGKGVGAWAIWTAFNIAAIPVFAFGYHYFKRLRVATEYKFFNAFMIFVQVFAVWMNMQAIFEILSGRVSIGIPGVVSAPVAMAFVIALAVCVLAAIWHFGFFGSAISDQVQYIGMVGLLVAIIVVGLAIGGGFNEVLMESSSSDINWALWVGVGLIAGPYMDGMQWERIEKVDEGTRRKAGLLGGFYFGVYLLLVGAAALVLRETAFVVVMLLFLTSLMVDSSTLDSAVSAKQYLMRKGWGRGRNWAAAITLLAIAAWPFLNSIGAVMLQTIYSIGRLWVWIIMLIFFLVLKPLYERFTVEV